MIHHLLIVEDGMTLPRNLARAMDRAGIAVQVATNGEEARRALNGGRFDILCSDLRLPDCNGLDLLADIRHAIPGSRYRPWEDTARPRRGDGAAPLSRPRRILGREYMMEYIFNSNLRNVLCCCIWMRFELTPFDRHRIFLIILIY